MDARVIRSRYLSGQEASRYLGRSDEWLRRKVNAGLIPFKINPSNNRKVYDRLILDRFIRPVSIEEMILKTA